MLEFYIQKPSDYLFWFSFGNYVMDQRSGDGLFIGRIEISAISLWKGFSKLQDAGREETSRSEEDHPEFPPQEEGQSRGTESPEKGSVSIWNTDCLHDPRLLSSCWCSWYSDGFRCLFSVTLHNDNVQEIWHKIGRSFMSKIPYDDVLEILYKLRKREFAQLKTILEFYDMEIHQELRLRNFDARNERIEIRAVVTISKGQRDIGRGPGECHQWKAKRTVVERRHVVTDTMKISVQTRHQKPLNPLSHQDTEVGVRRGKKPRGVEFTWEVRSTVVQRPLEMYLHQITFVIFGILLKFNSINHSRDVNSVMCSFAQAGWRWTWQKKNEKGWWQMFSDYIENYTTVVLRISGHRAAGIFIDFTEEPNSLGINSTSAMHKSFTASCKHPRKQRSAARNIQLKIPHQRSL